MLLREVSFYTATDRLFDGAMVESLVRVFSVSSGPPLTSVAYDFASDDIN